LVLVCSKSYGQDRLDTIPVILLLSDTSKDYQVKVTTYSCYEVRLVERVCCKPQVIAIAEYYDSYTHVKYLTKNKKELPKNIVVWMAQPLNKNK